MDVKNKATKTPCETDILEAETLESLVVKEHYCAAGRLLLA